MATRRHEVPSPPLKGEVPNEREAEGFVRQLSSKTPQSARSGCQLPFQGSQGGFAAAVHMRYSIIIYKLFTRAIVLFGAKKQLRIPRFFAILLRGKPARRSFDMLEELRKQVYCANMELPRRNLVTFTWGNVSGIDRETGLLVIKPSGVEYEELTPEKLVVVDLHGSVVEGDLNPSSDTKTHIELYKAFPQLGGIVHTHSPYAVAWAQAGKDIPCYGTTHADYFYGSIPCARHLTQEELDEDYEKGTGTVIIEEIRKRNIDPVAIPAIICHSHGPFAWGKNPAQAVYHAAVLEEVAKMALLTRQIDPSAAPAPQRILNKHYLRKHGPNAYYGQK